MLPTVMLFSSAIIDRTTFRHFLADLGVELQPGYPDREGHWFRGKQSLLISLHPDWMEEYGEEDSTILTVRAMLDTAPQTCVVVDFTRSEGSGVFAVEFANAVNQRWPVVVADEADQFYDGSAISRLLAEGRGFSLTTTGESVT